MTTSVDILFKELPASPAAPGRKNVSDIASSAPAEKANGTHKSNNSAKSIDGAEKSFEQHLAEQPQNTDKTTAPKNENDTFTDNIPTKGTHVIHTEQEEVSTDQIAATVAQAPNENVNPGTAVPTLLKNGDTQHVVVPTQDSLPKDDKAKKKVDPQHNIENSSNATDNTQAQRTYAPTEVTQQSSAKTANSDNPISSKPASAPTSETNIIAAPSNTNGTAPLNEPVQMAEKIVDTAQPEKQKQGSSSAVIANTQSMVNSESSTQTVKSENTTQPELASTAANSGTSIINDQSALAENTSPTITLNAEAVIPLPEKQIPESKAPTETVMIEATRTLQVAPVPNAAPTAKPTPATGKTSAIGKNEAKASSSASGTANASSAATAQAAKTGNVASPGTQYTNAFKSEIQLDLGGFGQKTEPAPLLSPTLTNNQGQVSSTGLLAAQEITLQKTASSLPSVVKTDTPAMTRMINEQITVAINRHVVNGQNNFNVRLHPAELGQVDIRIEFATDGKMQASMVVDNERTLAMLQRDQSALEKALQDAGINLSNKNLNFSLKKQGEQYPDQQLAENGNQDDEGEFLKQTNSIGAMQEVSMGYSEQSLDISV